MPITTTISQTGVVSYTFEQTDAEAYVRESATGPNNLLMKVVINGDEWTATKN